MLFRGYFLGRLKLVTQSKAWAIALSAGLFGLWHFPVGQDILQVIVTGILGAVYAFMMFRLKGCTTLSVALAHGLHDIFLLVLGTALS